MSELTILHQIELLLKMVLDYTHVAAEYCQLDDATPVIAQLKRLEKALSPNELKNFRLMIDDLWARAEHPMETLRQTNPKLYEALVYILEALAGIYGAISQAVISVVSGRGRALEEEEECGRLRKRRRSAEIADAPPPPSLVSSFVSFPPPNGVGNGPPRRSLAHAAGPEAVRLPTGRNQYKGIVPAPRIYDSKSLYPGWNLRRLE